MTAAAIVAMLLGGYPQFIPYAVLLSMILSFSREEWKRWLFFWIVTVFCAVGVSAFAWMPFLETVQNSTRALQTAAQSGQGGLHLTDLLSLVLPTFFSNPQSGLKWGPVWNSAGTTVPYLSWIGIVLVTFLFWKRKQTKRDLLFFGLCIIVFGIAFSS